MGKNISIFVLIGVLFMSITSFAQNTVEYPSYSSNDLKIENQILIYPNPSVDFLKVSIEESTLENPEIVIHSILGNKLEINSEQTGANEFNVDVKNLPSGYYLLAVKDKASGFSKTYKFLKR